MKKTITAIVFVLAIVAAVPFASGLIMERTVRQALDGANSIYADTGMGYSLEIVNYDRGYLASDIEWKIDLGALKDFYHIEDVVFKEHAKHGFTGVVSATSLEKNPWYAAFVDEHLQGRDPIQITTTYGLSGKIESTIALDAFSVTVEDETIEVKPGRMVSTTDNRLRHFNISGNWQGLSAGDTLTIGKISMASELEMLSTYLWDGNFSFGLQNFSVREKDEHIELQEFQGDYLVDIDDDRSSMSGEARFSVDRLKGKNLMLDDTSVRLAARGVNVEGYEEFMKMYTQTMSAAVGNMANLEEDPEQAKAILNQQMAAAGLQIMAAYEKLLSQGLELRIADLQVKMPEGDITGDLTLRLLKDMTFMQFAPLVAQPELLTDIFYLKSNLSLPAGLTGEDPKLLGPVYPGMQTGLFVKDGDNLVHQAETVDGKLMVNNQEVILMR